MGIIIGGIRMARFDSLRLKFGMMRQRGIPVDYWSCLGEYRNLDILNIALPKSDSRHPAGWSRDPPHSPANAAFKHGQGSGSQGSGSAKRDLECTWGPCPNKKSHREDNCWTKHPHLRRSKFGSQGKAPVPINLALPATLTPKQLSSLQAQIDGYALDKK